MNPAYVQAACHCRPLKMCAFCRDWLKPSKPKNTPNPKAPEGVAVAAALHRAAGR